MSAPVHLVPPGVSHGVAIYARQVAAAVGAGTVAPDQVLRLPSQPVHVHVSDSLYAATCEEAADLLCAVARRHPTTGWATNSHHEAALARRHLGGPPAETVIPLPVLVGSGEPAPAGPRLPAASPVVAVLGWVYPGKGHAEVLRACADLDPGTTVPVVVRALGSLASGHDRLGEELAELAASLGVGFEVAGWVPDVELPGTLAGVDVPVAAHRKVSASGSVNSWLAAGRRPLVAAGPYAAEMAALRPGTLTLVPPGPAALAGAIGRALRDPASTRLGPEVSTGAGLAEVAAAYTRWWEGR